MKHYIFLFMAIATCFNTLAFSGNGAGTEKSPYLITSADELFEVRNDLFAFYELANDIDLTRFITEDNPQYGWLPIGNNETPFCGTFDGKNHSIVGLYVNRGDNSGMWGVLRNATIKNLSFINPVVIGGTNVGIVAGKINMPYSNSISHITIIHGSVSGNNCVGGIVGSALLYYSGYWGDYADTKPDITDSKNAITECYCDVLITGGTECGGICGSSNGEYNTYEFGSKHVYEVELSDNIFCGKIHGEDLVGGILGRIRETEGRHYIKGGTYGGTWSENGNYTVCNRNIGAGSLFSEGATGGILGNYCKDVMISSQNGTRDNMSSVNFNVSCADTISGENIYRISNVDFKNNIGCSKTIGFQNNKHYDFEDSDNNGAGYGANVLRKRTTYEGLGFDFNKIWSISEGMSLPYHMGMSMYPTIEVYNAGSKGYISGTSISDGMVYIIHNNNVYRTYSLDGKWELSLGKINIGEAIYAVYCNDNLRPSIPIIAYATEKIVPPSEVISGDSNSDGAVDAADVVSIINYILGKPSASFNQKNADVNGDGSVLVDDAVGTIGIIMSKQ